MIPTHGGNVSEEARQLNCRVDQLLDASASLVPFSMPRNLRKALQIAISSGALREYPDLNHHSFRSVISHWHGIDSSMVLPGNGAAELFTWAARDASKQGVSVIPAPCFGDYVRALKCWNARYFYSPLPFAWSTAQPQPFPFQPGANVLWITNPHNPTGHLWSRESLEQILPKYQLVVCDEAFLPLVPNGEKESLIPLVEKHSNLVVIRSLTKLFALAGLRIGYAIGSPDRLLKWSQWRDPWPVNGLALSVAISLIQDEYFMNWWLARIHNWIRKELPWLEQELASLPGIEPYPSAVNFILIKGDQSLVKLRNDLAQKFILIRDCRSFPNLGEKWLRISLQSRRQNRRIIEGIRTSLRQVV